MPHRKLQSILYVFLFLTSGMIWSQDLSLYKREVFVSKSDTLPYRILLPKDYDSAKEYPLLLFLHGSGERGADNELQLVHGANLFLKEEVRNSFPSIVVFPQCGAGLAWHNATTSYPNAVKTYHYPTKISPNGQLDLVEGLLRQLKKELAVDQNRMYLGGLSMGGMGTFELLHRNPNTFAAAFSICGGANPSIAKFIKATPLWIFHGEKDDVVPALYSKEMYKALKDYRPDVKITLYPEVKHDSWTNAFEEPELLSWLISKQLN